MKNLKEIQENVKFTQFDEEKTVFLKLDYSAFRKWSKQIKDYGFKFDSESKRWFKSTRTIAAGLNQFVDEVR
jgi:hypothetical protein